MCAAFPLIFIKPFQRSLPLDTKEPEAIPEAQTHCDKNVSSAKQTVRRTDSVQSVGSIREKNNQLKLMKPIRGGLFKHHEEVYSNLFFLFSPIVKHFKERALALGRRFAVNSACLFLYLFGAKHKSEVAVLHD